MNLIDILRGIVIGVANIIPGVSGGTLALVLGIYERLIGAIQNISFETLRATTGVLRFNRSNWKAFTAELRRIDAFFLASILIGALIISVLANGLRILSVAQEWQTVVTGSIIILAVYADILRRRTL